MKTARRVLTAMLLTLVSLAVLARPAAAASPAVTTTADSGAGSLRQAIIDANASGVASSISFAIPGAGIHAIQLATELPAVAVPLTIDARTQAGYVDHPLVELEDAQFNATFTLLSFTASASGSTVAGLAAKRYADAISAVGTITVEDSYIGLHADGSLDFGENPVGVNQLNQGYGVTVGSHSSVRHNVLAANAHTAILVCGDSVAVEDNIIGADPTALQPVANGGGVGLCASSTAATIGSPGHGNRFGASTGGQVADSGTSTHIVDNTFGIGSDGTTLLQSIIGIAEGPTASGARITGNLLVSGAFESIAIDGADVEVSDNRIGETIGGVTSPFDTNGIVVDGPNASIHDNDISHQRDAGIRIAPTGIGAPSSPPAAGTSIVQNTIHDNGAAGAYVGDSIAVDDGATGTIQANTISGSKGAGVHVTASTAAFTILDNRIAGNGGLGIDLGPTGVNQNDPGDNDAGANGLQNSPSISTVHRAGATVTVTGFIVTKPSTTVTIQLFQVPSCDSSGYGEADVRRPPNLTITTNGSGQGEFTSAIAVDDSLGQRWTATATTAEGTSELSVCHLAVDAGTIAYITSAYRTLLGREPDQAGLDYWFDRLFAGADRTSIVQSFTHLPEYAGLFVDQVYQAILRRAPDAGGRAFWSDYIQRGGKPDDLRSLIYGSPEYFTAQGGSTNDGFVTAAYRDILGRAPDGGGRAYWLALLSGGTSRAQVAGDMLGLPEPIAVAISRLYNTFLHRSPDSSETTYWSGVWRSEGELAVLAGLFGSIEYYNNLTV